MDASSAIDELEAKLTSARSFYALNENVEAPPTFLYGPKTLRDICSKAMMRSSVFLVLEDCQYSYQDVFSSACRVADALHRRVNVEPGQRVLLCGEDKVEWVIGFLAIILLGTSAVLAQGGNELWQKMDCRCAVVAAGARSGAPFQGLGTDDINSYTVSDLIELGSTGASVGATKFNDPGDEALVAFTSGTSGQPKPISVSHRSITTGLMNALLASAMSAGIRQQPSPTRSRPPLPLLMGPLSHVSGYTQLLLAMMLGSAIAFTCDSASPAIASFVAAVGITSLVGLSPEIGRELLIGSNATETLRSVRTWNISGSRANPRYVELINRVLPDVSLTSGYGLTETNGVISAIRYGRGISQAALGRVVPTAQVMITRVDGGQVAVGKVGCLKIRGAMMMTGYCDSQGAVRPLGPWFDTGDIGYLTDQRELFVLGRASEILAYCDEPLSLPDLEQHLQNITGAYEVAIQAEAGAIMIALAGVIETAAMLDEIRASLLHKFGISPADTRCTFFGSIPRSSSGKISIDAIRSLTIKNRSDLLKS